MSDNDKEYVGINKNDSRILYVEPNNIYGNVGDIPMTPDYTDFSIWCNLIVEKSSRLTNQYLGDSNDDSYSISANITNDTNGIEYYSFLRGSDAENYNYLSTDYTDIHFNSVKNHTFVEGLQISGIDISYANRMAPTVVMQMVDIRGAGLFGREEAIHGADGINVNNMDSHVNNKGEKEYIDNIYSGFMSFPYPRYKLHIKGYYGRAVTYQLTCSNFIGKFDSSTGNFNITATFIGYEYGLLQDLPLSYVMAAPLTSVGKAYWNAHVNSDEWNLFFKARNEDGEPKREAPILMHTFLTKIKAQIAKYEKNTNNSKTSTDNESGTNKSESSDTSNSNAGSNENTSAQNPNDDILGESWETIQNDYTERKERLNALTSLIDTFTNSITECNSQCDVVTIKDTDDPDGDYMLIILSKTSSVSVDNTTAETYNSIGDTLLDYSNRFSGDNIGLSMLASNPDNLWETNNKWKIAANVPINKYFEISQEGSGKRAVFVSPKGEYKKVLSSSDGESDFDDPLMKFGAFQSTSKDDTSLNAVQSYKLYSYLREIYFTDKFKPYVTILNFKGFMRVFTAINTLDARYEEYKEKINSKKLLPITSVTGGVTPYIGNYFKMVFCHVETFIYTIWNCVNAIYAEMHNGDRAPAKMGISNSDMVDVPSEILNGSGLIRQKEGIVPPFPAIYKKIKGDYDASTYDTSKTIGWVGNIHGSHPWQEKELVDEYYYALQLIQHDSGDIPWLETDRLLLEFNLLPCLLDFKQNVSLYTTRDGLAYYTGTLGSWILGVINNGKDVSKEEAEIIGAILAEVLFDASDNKERLIQLCKGGKLNDELYKIAGITEIDANKESKRFECGSTSSSDNRHRIIEENGDNVNYAYMRTFNKHSLIPLDSIEKWNDIPLKYLIETDDDDKLSIFTPKTIIDGDYIITEDSKKFYAPYNISTDTSTNTSTDSTDDTKQENRVEYVNNRMFSIWMDSCNVANMDIAYDSYKKDGLDIGPYKKDKIVKAILDKYWLMKDNYDKYQSVNISKLSENKLSVPQDFLLTECVEESENNGNSEIKYNVDKDFFNKVKKLEY